MANIHDVLDLYLTHKFKLPKDNYKLSYECNALDWLLNDIVFELVKRYKLGAECMLDLDNNIREQMKYDFPKVFPELFSELYENNMNNFSLKYVNTTGALNYLNEYELAEIFRKFPTKYYE